MKVAEDQWTRLQFFGSIATKKTNFPNMTRKTIAIIGLGYVGLPLAVEFGKQRATIGFDINTKRIEELQSGQDHTLECTPQELKTAAHLRYSANTQDLKDAQIFIVTVPTPVDTANRPDMTPLVKASETVGKVLSMRCTKPYLEACRAVWQTPLPPMKQIFLDF